MLLSGQIYHKYKNHPHYGQLRKLHAASAQLAIAALPFPLTHSLSLSFSLSVCLPGVCVCVFFIAVSTRPLAMLTDNMLRLRQPLREMVSPKQQQQQQQRQKIKKKTTKKVDNIHS